MFLPFMYFYIQDKFNPMTLDYVMNNNINPLNSALNRSQYLLWCGPTLIPDQFDPLSIYHNESYHLWPNVKKGHSVRKYYQERHSRESA